MFQELKYISEEEIKKYFHIKEPLECTVLIPKNVFSSKLSKYIDSVYYDYSNSEFKVSEEIMENTVDCVPSLQYYTIVIDIEKLIDIDKKLYSEYKLRA